MIKIILILSFLVVGISTLFFWLVEGQQPPVNINNKTMLNLTSIEENKSAINETTGTAISGNEVESNGRNLTFQSESMLPARNGIAIHRDVSPNIQSQFPQGTAIRVETPQNPSFLALQLAIGGFAAGLALFFGNIGLDYYRRPDLKLAEESDSDPVSIDLNIYQTNNPQYELELRRYSVKYWVNRIPIRNRGRNAAKNCKVVLRMNDVEEKICWSIPKDRYITTINAKSLEYIDSCAIIDKDPAEIFKDLNNRITRFGNWVRHELSQTSDRSEMLEVEKHVSEFYRSADNIPRIISPTENGWQGPHFNRPINPGPAEIIVTAENCTPLHIYVTISDDNNEKHKIIKIETSKNEPSLMRSWYDKLQKRIGAVNR